MEQIWRRHWRDPHTPRRAGITSSNTLSIRPSFLLLIPDWDHLTLPRLNPPFFWGNPWTLSHKLNTYNCYLILNTIAIDNMQWTEVNLFCESLKVTNVRMLVEIPKCSLNVGVFPSLLPGSRKRWSGFSACCLAQLRPNSPRISAPSCKKPAKSVLAKVSLTERICSITGVCQLSFSRFRTLAMVGPLSGMRGRRLNENNRLCVW